MVAAWRKFNIHSWLTKDAVDLIGSASGAHDMEVNREEVNFSRGRRAGD
jgi:hypothetical protein